MGGPATPGALLIIGGVGLVFYAVWSPSGVLARNPISPLPTGTGNSGGVTGASSGGSAGAPPAYAGNAGQINAFMESIAHFESGGSYTAVTKAHPENPEGQTYAYGKYQFLVRSYDGGKTFDWSTGLWGELSRRYFGHVVPGTPDNQEIMARRYFLEKYGKYHDWSLVALDWRSGPGYTAQHLGADRSSWSNGSKLYVGRVITRMVVNNLRGVYNWIDPKKVAHQSA